MKFELMFLAVAFIAIAATCGTPAHADVQSAAITATPDIALVSTETAAIPDMPCNQVMRCCSASDVVVVEKNYNDDLAATANKNRNINRVLKYPC